MIKKVFIIMGVLLLFAACAPREAPAPVTVPVLGEKAEPAKAAWEIQWDKTLAEAKKEGLVMIYTSREREMVLAWQRAFENRYGIKMDGVSGRGATMAEKMLSERRAGLYMVDIHTSGATNPVLNLKPAGALAPLEDKLILPEVADPSLWYGGKHLWVDKSKTIINALGYPSGDIVINTNLVNPGEIKKIRDLLNPKFKGKIVINDPTITGTGAKLFGVVVFRYDWGLDFWRELVRKQEPAIIRDQRLMMDWIAQGKYGIAVPAETEPFLRALAAGAPVQRVDLEDVSYLTGDVVMIMDKAPHPNAAKVFLNWMLSREGLDIYQRMKASQSARADLPIPDVPGMRYRTPGIGYFNSNDEDFLKAQDEHMKTALEVFGPLMAK